jgi:plasmid stabilization system protein ParE
MTSYRLTSKAEEDLLDIWSSIAEHYSVLSRGRSTRHLVEFSHPI